MGNFSDYVNDVLDSEPHGEVVHTEYGTNKEGKRFAVVITHVVWYAVRLIIEGKGNVTMTSQHLTLGGAKTAAIRVVRDLED
uniref:Uncharacterized protein n=1 Tax=Acrobeloides nanus TaxID=290746 RepID=A0A914DHL3_9BILA